MRFLISMIGDETFMEEATPELMEEVVAQMDDYNKQLEDAGVFVTADGLGPSSTAKTLRYGMDGKAVVTDGPFAETKEQVAGYWIFECEDVDEAVEWARKAPIKGAVIEVRPIVDTAEENFEAFKEQAQKS
jgi:hypothetical protein